MVHFRLLNQENMDFIMGTRKTVFGGCFLELQIRSCLFQYRKRKNFYYRIIGIWDVIKSCTIKGSDDSSIKNVTVNDFTKILNKSDIRAIFANGNKAYDLYEKYVFETVGIKAVKLPSTSPANARWNLEKLETAYSEMLKYIAD